MLWLIWIAVILLVPIGAGVQVWWQLHRLPEQAAVVPRLAQGALPHEGDGSDGKAAL